MDTFSKNRISPGDHFKVQTCPWSRSWFLNVPDRGRDQIPRHSCVLLPGTTFLFSIAQVAAWTHHSHFFFSCMHVAPFCSHPTSSQQNVVMASIIQYDIIVYTCPLDLAMVYMASCYSCSLLLLVLNLPILSTSFPLYMDVKDTLTFFLPLNVHLQPFSEYPSKTFTSFIIIFTFFLIYMSTLKCAFIAIGAT